MTELEAMQAHRQTLVQMLKDMESGTMKMMQGVTHHLTDVTEYEITALKTDIADLNRYIIEDGGTLDG